MSEVEVFPRAPIEEAILALEFPTALDDLSLSAEHFHNAIRDAFPERSDIPEQQGRSPVTRRNFGRLSGITRDQGCRFQSADGRDVVQITRTSFSFHRLHPYLDWGHFEAVVQPVWRAFVGYFDPEAISNLRLRYLNRIEVPLPFRDLQEYLLMYPEIPRAVDTGFTGYLMRLSLIDSSVPATAHVTQSTDFEFGRGVLPVVFDIEVRRQGEVPREGDVFWGAVRGLRDYKNRLFFESLTERARDLFR